jgi:hypothetical protein
MATSDSGLVRRWTRIPAKALLLLSFVACVLGTIIVGITGGGVATVIVGFGWGGWVTGGTATQIANRAAARARSWRQLIASRDSGMIRLDWLNWLR